MEQYFLEGYLGLPTFILQKLGSAFSSRPSYWMIFLRFKLRFKCPSFLALLFTRFSFLCFLGSPSPTSKPSSSSSSAILLGSSKKSSSRQRSFSSMTARRLFSSTLRTAAEKRLFLPPWRVLGMALDIIYKPIYNPLIYRMIGIQSLPYLCMIMLAVSVASKMAIQSPPELSAYFAEKYGEAGIPYSIANYGIVPYGKVISGQMGTPEFLQDCLYEEIPEKARRSVLLVQRNDCTFTQKSINVQKQGGKMAVIIDNRIERPEDVVMIDDGKGHSVTIPTVMVGREDGLKMLEYINQNPIIMVSFDLKESARSNVTLWIDILDHKNYIFLRTFQSYFKRIANNIDFNIAYPTSRCASNCNDNHCFYDGKYCRYTVGRNFIENAGKQVIRQQLRQYNVFQQDVNKWWEYMLRFDDSCDDIATYDECSSRVLAALDIKYTTVSNKVDQSFGDEDNSVLQAFSQLKYNNSILYYPSIVINSMVYRGNLESYQVFETICESMTPMPQGCSDDAVEQTHLTGWIIFGVVSVIIFVLFLVVCYRRIARRQLSMEMNKKVNELVNEYISMYEVEKFKQGETEMKNKK